MTHPIVHAEVAWSTDPLTRPGSMDWTRLTGNAVRYLATRRGFQMRTGEPETGTASAVLDNRNRDLDPTNTGGTYYPDVKPRRRVRFLVDPDGSGSTETEVFTGYIDRITPAVDLSVADEVVELEAVDLLALLAAKQLPPSVLHQTTVDLEPVAYWPLAETQGNVADDIAGASDGAYTRTVGRNEEMFPYDPRPRVRCGAPSIDDPLVQNVSVFPFSGATTQTVSLWVYFDEESASGPASTWEQTNGPGITYTRSTGIGMGTDQISIGAYDGSTSELGVVTPTSTLYGLHHLAVTWDAGVTADPDAGVYAINAYLDGKLAPWDQSDPDNPVDPFVGVNLTTALSGVDRVDFGHSVGSTSAQISAVVGEVAFWDSALTSSQIQTIYEAGVEAWDGDTTGTRLGRVLDALGVDAGDRDIATGQEYCGPTLLGGGNALDYLRRIVATEGGALFVAPDGKVTFTERPANDPTPLDVIGDSGCPIAELVPEYGLERVVNVAEVTRENGITHSYADDTSVTAYGPRSVTLDTLHQTPSGARSSAAILVVKGKDPRQVFTSVGLNRHPDVPTSVTLDAEIGDPYTIQPPVGGTALVRVESIEHTLDAASASWFTRFGVDQQVVLPTTKLDTAGRGTDQSVLAS